MHVHPYEKKEKKCTGIRNKAIIYIEFESVRCAGGYNIISSYMSNNNNIKITEKQVRREEVLTFHFHFQSPHQYMMFFPFLVLILNDEKNVLIITCCIVIVRNALVSYQ
jgi:hypothetical protein